MLAYTDFNFASPVLAKLLDARQPPELQLQAIRAIERRQGLVLAVALATEFGLLLVRSPGATGRLAEFIFLGDEGAIGTTDVTSVAQAAAAKIDAFPGG